MLSIGTKVNCDYRGELVGTVIARNDVRIWSNTLAFHGTPTQEQVDKHIAWCLDNGLSFDHETAIDWGDNCYRWDDTKQLHPMA